MFYVSFKPNGRTGNLLFQYLACKLIEHRFGHVYLNYEVFRNLNEYEILNDNQFFGLNDDNYPLTNILLDGFFQKSEIYTKYRQDLMKLLYSSLSDSWMLDGIKYHIGDFLKLNDEVLPIRSFDVVISLRLDDFIQLPRERSDILPPSFYLNFLNTIPKETDSKILIVCDKIRHKWEFEYIKCLELFNPVMIKHIEGNELMNDFEILRDCPILIHSNSTFCWIASFLSNLETKQRIIPKTNFYKGQDLGKIEESDILLDVETLTHEEVFNLSFESLRRYPVYPFAYSIPDELIIKNIPEKSIEISDIQPRTISNSSYQFNPSQEKEYYEAYQKAKFAITRKKGGWDTLRHYEIMANGCIPLFENLEECPYLSLNSFPKRLIEDINKNIEDLKKYNYIYNGYMTRLLDAVRKSCSSSSRVEEFLERMNIKNNQPKILMLSGDTNINYLRETFWIGIKNKFKNDCQEYPILNFLYDDFPIENFNGMVGNGFTYGRKIPSEYKSNLDEEKVKSSILKREWDVIVYGRVGPDETYLGSLPDLPFWNEVLFSEIPIAFLYGGDEPYILSKSNLTNFHRKYTEHLDLHSKYGVCFVRELQ